SESKVTGREEQAGGLAHNPWSVRRLLARQLPPENVGEVDQTQWYELRALRLPGQVEIPVGAAAENGKGDQEYPHRLETEEEYRHDGLAGVCTRWVLRRLAEESNRHEPKRVDGREDAAGQPGVVIDQQLLNAVQKHRSVGRTEPASHGVERVTEP